MYQYKAILKSSKEKIAENHTLENIEHDIKHFRRKQKKGIHTKGNEPIEIFHVHTDTKKEKLIKIV